MKNKIDLKERPIALKFKGCKGMTWADLIRHFKPEATEDEVGEIYEKCYSQAYDDAVAGRRTEMPNSMIFDTIQFWYFKAQLPQTK